MACWDLQSSLSLFMLRDTLQAAVGCLAQKWWAHTSHIKHAVLVCYTIYNPLYICLSCYRGSRLSLFLIWFYQLGPFMNWIFLIHAREMRQVFRGVRLYGLEDRDCNFLYSTQHNGYLVLTGVLTIFNRAQRQFTVGSEESFLHTSSESLVL